MSQYKVEVQKPVDNMITITLEGSSADIFAGNKGTDGFITLMDKNGHKTIQMGHDVTSTGGDTPDEPLIITQFTGIKIAAPGGVDSITLSASNESGSFVNLKDSSGLNTFQFNGQDARFKIGTNSKAGELFVIDTQGKEAIHLRGKNAALYVGATGNEGDIRVRDGEGRDVFNVDGRNAALYVGATGNEGDIRVRDGEGRDVFNVDGRNAALYVGATGNEGDIRVRDGEGRDVFNVDGRNAALYVGATGNEGDIRVRDGEGKERIQLNGLTGGLSLSAKKNFGGDLVPSIIMDPISSSISIMEIDNSIEGKHLPRVDITARDINFSNADCAEEFDISPTQYSKARPGTVMVIDDDGNLQISSRPYDKRVAGVISGAGDLKPGIVLDKKESHNLRAPLAMLGKVLCKVDAQYSAIQVGDLLTTSSNPGYAMNAVDSMKSFGTVIGKALQKLEGGKSLIPILVSLQ